MSLLAALLTLAACVQAGASLPGFGAWRTDFDDPELGGPRKPITLTPCAFTAGSGQGTVVGHDKLCDLIKDQLADPSLNYIPTRYRRSNSAGGGNWVLHVNDEPAFHKDHDGPPGQSHPVNGGIVGVETSGGGVELSLSNASIGGKPTNGGIPFVSIGLQTGRGTSGPVLPDARYTVAFKAGATAAGAPHMGNALHFWVEAGGAWYWLFLGSKNTAPADPQHVVAWNWPIKESMWHPGRMITMNSIPSYNSYCKEKIPDLEKLPEIDLAGGGGQAEYEINLQDMLQCMGGLPKTTRITGLHFGIEENTGKDGGDGVDRNSMTGSFSDLKALRNCEFKPPPTHACRANGGGYERFCAVEKDEECARPKSGGGPRFERLDKRCFERRIATCAQLTATLEQEHRAARRGLYSEANAALRAKIESYEPLLRELAWNNPYAAAYDPATDSFVFPNPDRVDGQAALASLDALIASPQAQALLRGPDWLSYWNPCGAFATAGHGCLTRGPDGSFQNPLLNPTRNPLARGDGPHIGQNCTPPPGSTNPLARCPAPAASGNPGLSTSTGTHTSMAGGPGSGGINVPRTPDGRAVRGGERGWNTPRQHEQ